MNPAELKQHTEEVVAPKLEPEKQPEVILEPVDNRKNNPRLENHIDNDSSFFTTGSSFPRHRPFQEIVSSVQGSFNFLQESTIDLDCKYVFFKLVASETRELCPLSFH